MSVPMSLRVGLILILLVKLKLKKVLLSALNVAPQM